MLTRSSKNNAEISILSKKNIQSGMNMNV